MGFWGATLILMEVAPKKRVQACSHLTKNCEKTGHAACNYHIRGILSQLTSQDSWKPQRQGVQHNKVVFQVAIVVVGDVFFFTRVFVQHVYFQMGSRTSKQLQATGTWKLLSYWFQGVEKTVRATQMFFFLKLAARARSLQKGRILVCVLANKASGWGQGPGSRFLKVPHKGSGSRGSTQTFHTSKVPNSTQGFRRKVPN